MVLVAAKEGEPRAAGSDPVRVPLASRFEEGEANGFPPPSGRVGREAGQGVVTTNGGSGTSRNGMLLWTCRIRP